MNGSPTDRSKRPRRDDEEYNSDNDRDGQDDRHPKRQAVPDPETKAPHFAGSESERQDHGSSAGSNRSRRKKWEEGSQHESEDDEVQIVVSEHDANKSTTTNQTTPTTTSAPPVHYTKEEQQQQQLAANGDSSISVRSLVSTKEAGVIIGRGGKNVSDIRELSAARVTISDIVQGAYERILTVTGPAPAVAKAYALVAEKILTELPSNEEGQDQTLTIRLLVPDNRMGSLIGRAGSVIRSIQEQSHARVNASEEPLPMSTERTVTIVGAAASVQSAVQQICEILAEHSDRSGSTSSTIQYRPQPQGMGGMNGRGYGTGMSRNAAAGGGSSGSGSGSVSNPAAAAAAMNPYGAAMMGHMGAMQMNGAANPQFYYQAAAAAAAANAYGMAGVSGRHDYGMAGMVATSSQAQQIFIPNEMVGCIIGKGGSKINEIRQLSGSHIKIADPHGNTNERLVTITGTPESNQMALYLLYSRLESEKSRLGLQ